MYHEYKRFHVRCKILTAYTVIYLQRNIVNKCKHDNKRPLPYFYRVKDVSFADYNKYIDFR